MLATELLFVYVYYLLDDVIKAGVRSIPRRPGSAADCTDAELLTIALVRHLLGRRSESGSWPRSAATGPARRTHFEGLLTRTVATLAAHTLLLTLLAEAI